MTTLQIIAWLGLVCAAFAVGVFAGLVMAKDAPICTCGKVDCGGECIDWEPR